MDCAMLYALKFIGSINSSRRISPMLGGSIKFNFITSPFLIHNLNVSSFCKMKAKAQYIFSVSLSLNVVIISKSVPSPRVVVNTPSNE